jgi:outer membrane protein OmpA-like peptidoglycan-associated protein
MKRFIILASIILYCFSNSYAQNKSTFNWTDTTFTVGSERLITIIWDLDYSGMRPESKVTCDTVVNFMKKNPNLQIGIYCNTDQQGSPTHNMRLSQARAQCVVSYIRYQGIDSARLVPKGWGFTRLIYTTPEIMSIKDADPKIQKHKRDSLYQANRRTEVVILKTDYKK